VAALGCVGGLLGDAYALTSLALVVPFIVFLNLHSLKRDSDTEMTTSAALLLLDFVGILCGKGHTFTPVALGLSTAGLLAWKGKLSGFSTGITEAELRSAILLGVLAFVIFPVLPGQPVDRWGLVEPRAIWTTVILIASIGFGNYILLKLYGSRGVEMASFLAGLVNSTVAVTELSLRAASDRSLAALVYRGTLLATAAMLVRNAVLLAILSPEALAFAGTPMLLMLLTCLALAFAKRGRPVDRQAKTPQIELSSPFSLPQALKFAALFLLLSIVGTLAERILGSTGFYAVSAAGGLISSASSVASAGQLVSHGKLSAEAGGIGAALATITSASISIPLVMRLVKDQAITKSVSVAIAVVAIVGLLGTAIVPRGLQRNSHSIIKFRILLRGRSFSFDGMSGTAFSGWLSSP
jgi:uncharacterized membrane protein (DUF4010 family)